MVDEHCWLPRHQRLGEWYLNEARSDEFEALLRKEASALISRLTILEFRCLLVRRRRSGESVERYVVAAAEIAAVPKPHPLRSLDALRLGIARESGVERIATADRLLAEAAESLRFRAVRFD